VGDGHEKTGEVFGGRFHLQKMGEKMSGFGLMNVTVLEQHQRASGD
jgi:CobQ-like glutamine amidotransferase family enzyme